MRPPPRVRLFVAIYPSAEWIAAASGVLPVAGLEDARPTPPEQLHLTLAFLGERRQRDVPEILASLQASASPVREFDLSSSGLALLPDVQRPRLIAASLSAPQALLELQSRVVKRLTLPREKRTDFMPHITLARFEEHRERAASPLPQAYLPAFRVREACLVVSTLHPRGARHRIIERVTLGGGSTSTVATP